MLVFVAGTLAVIALAIAAVRGRTELVIGVAIGLALAGIGAVAAPAFSGHSIPVWLPALPFALVAATLFGFGVLAWWWGTDR